MSSNINYLQRKGSYQLKLGALVSAMIIAFASILFRYEILSVETVQILPILNLVFCLALIVAIGCKEKIEDERVIAFRALSDNAAFGLLVGFVLLSQIDLVLGSRWVEYKLLAYLTMTLLFHQIFFLVNTYHPRLGFLKKGGTKSWRVVLAVVIVFIFQYIIWGTYL